MPLITTRDRPLYAPGPERAREKRNANGRSPFLAAIPPHTTGSEIARGRPTEGRRLFEVNRAVGLMAGATKAGRILKSARCRSARARSLAASINLSPKRRHSGKKREKGDEDGRGKGGRKRKRRRRNSVFSYASFARAPESRTSPGDLQVHANLSRYRENGSTPRNTGVS